MLLNFYTTSNIKLSGKKLQCTVSSIYNDIRHLTFINYIWCFLSTLKGYTTYKTTLRAAKDFWYWTLQKIKCIFTLSMYIIILYAVQLINIKFFVMCLIFLILYRFGNIAYKVSNRHCNRLTMIVWPLNSSYDTFKILFKLYKDWQTIFWGRKWWSKKIYKILNCREVSESTRKCISMKICIHSLCSRKVTESLTKRITITKLSS